MMGSVINQFLHLNKSISPVHFDLSQAGARRKLGRAMRAFLLLAVLSAACRGPAVLETATLTASIAVPVTAATPATTSSAALNAFPTLPAPQAFTVTMTPLPGSLAASPPALSALATVSTNAPISTTAASKTPGAYAGLTIDDLASRSYGGGQIEAQQTLASNSFFTRTLITYPSDGLTIYGFADIPKKGRPPYPVVIALHGYVDPKIYTTLDYTTRYADDLARGGFFVLHPNLRGFPPSDNWLDLFRVGMAIDALNLIALVKDQAGKEGWLNLADGQAIGLWGHSMGGGVATRVMTVSRDLRAVVLYGAMSGDERKNYTRIFNVFSPQSRGQDELLAPPQAFLQISPVYYLDRVQAAVSIHHGASDTTVPPAWSEDTCTKLRNLGKTVECFSYPGEPHTFSGAGDNLFIERMVEFLDQRLIRR